MLRRELKKLAKRFVVIYGLTMLATFFICLGFNPVAEVGVVDYFGRCVLFALAADVSSLVYFSRHELSGREWWLRTALHCAVLEAVLMPLGHRWGMWGGWLGGVIFFFVVLLVKALVYLVGYGQDCAEASDLNRRLRERRAERETQ